ncbi:hypothetical protein C8R31_101645 [Nitrosospira sp. Nsp2]|nr:hypothetical protein C8R31_101645 [Nitrosospira sp. Nsp2]
MGRIRVISDSRLRQLYALAHAIPQRTDKKAVAKLWFERAKALLSREAGSRKR